MSREWVDDTERRRVDQLDLDCRQAVRWIRREVDNARCRLGLPVRDYDDQ